MVYRVSDVATSHDLEALARLEQLAIAGRQTRNAARERAVRAERAAERAAARRTAAEHRRKQWEMALRARLSTTRWAALGRPGRVIMAVLCAVVFPMVTMIPLFLFVVPAWVTLALLAATALAPPTAVGLARWLARRGARREAAWLASRPFPSRGHDQMLGAARLDEVHMIVRFRGTQPTPGLIADVITGVAQRSRGGVRRLLADSSRVIEHDGALAIAWKQGSSVENRRYHRWSRVMFDRVIAEIASVYPVHSITLRAA